MTVKVIEKDTLAHFLLKEMYDNIRNTAIPITLQLDSYLFEKETAVILFTYCSDSLKEPEGER